MAMFNRTYNRYIVDEYIERDIKFKLIPPEDNRIFLENIINEKSSKMEEFRDRNMVKNYRFFLESLNSTGLDFSQSDLIRNYILMDLERNEQNKIYKEIWISIENSFKVSDGSKLNSYVSDFIRDYLTLKNNKIPNKSKVFEVFKEFYLKDSCILKEVKEYSECYTLILKLTEDKDVRC